MKFYIDQHGCAKNQVDGEEIATRLEASGHLMVDSGEEAELVIVNTCGFIESAKKESIDSAIAARNLWPDKKILLAGCLAQRYADELLEGLPEVDGIFGNADLSGIDTAASAAMQGRRIASTPPQPECIDEAPIRRSRLFGYPGSANVKITEGCDNCCSYCAIPLIRGRLRSRSPDDVADECAQLVASGVKELVLIGQDLGSFGKDFGSSAGEAQADLPSLLRRLSKLEGNFWVRVLYIHPDHFPYGILEAMADDPRLLPYFDIPFQHASPGVLRAMNRRGDPDTYLKLIERIRSSLPQAMIRSTFLVGFPGETEEDFSILRDFQDRARLDWLGVFSYSREEGTRAYSMKGRVSAKAAAQRQRLIEEAQAKITAERLERFIGYEGQALVEEILQDGGMSIGRMWMQAPDVDGLTVLRGELEPGSFVRARVGSVAGVDLGAEPLAGEGFKK